MLDSIKVITKLPRNLPKGKAELINQQTDKISQQPKTGKTAMTLIAYELN
jgi:hypothetical protein